MKSPCQTIIKYQILHGVTGIRLLPAKAKPYFLFGAFEDNTYLWIVPNSHKASFKPRNHQLRKTMLVKMMKGDIIVCNALLLHAGYGYGTISNIRYHMCLWNRQLHLNCLYEVDYTNEETVKKSTMPGKEVALRFVENEHHKKLNKYGITTQRHDEDIKEKILTTINKKRKTQSLMNLIPKRKKG